MSVRKLESFARFRCPPGEERFPLLRARVTNEERLRTAIEVDRFLSRYGRDLRRGVAIGLVDSELGRSHSHYDGTTALRCSWSPSPSRSRVLLCRSNDGVARLTAGHFMLNGTDAPPL